MTGLVGIILGTRRFGSLLFHHKLPIANCFGATINDNPMIFGLFTEKRSLKTGFFASLAVLLLQY